MTLGEFSRSKRLDYVRFVVSEAYETEPERIIFVAYQESKPIADGNRQQECFGHLRGPDLPAPVVFYARFVLIAGDVVPVETLTGPVK